MLSEQKGFATTILNIVQDISGQNPKLKLEQYKTMAAQYSDGEIQGFIGERKLLPENYRSLIELKSKRGHSENQLDVTSDSGNVFRLILRRSDINHFNFSIILAILRGNSNQVFRLRRYNGNSHLHTNMIEGNEVLGFHIHTATERYQDLGGDEEHYAESTDRYSSYIEALQCMFEECGFKVPDDGQLALF
jgi:hypothetical protein